jgi:predicted nucleotidyltransferase
MGAWGSVRATQDIDLLMLLNDELRDRVFSTLALHNFKPDTRWAETNPMLKGMVTRLRHGPYPIDLIEPRDAHEREALTRRRSVEVEGIVVWVVSPKDLILLKLKAGRDQDFLDAKTVMVRKGESLDLEYLWSWADRLGLQSKLYYVLQVASPE